MQSLPSPTQTEQRSPNPNPTRGWETRPHFRALFQHLTAGDTGLRTLGVVGMGPGAGATTVATELALAAAVAGKRTLLVDANFESPAIGGIFRCPAGPGLAELLDGAATGSEAILSTALETLFLLPAGRRQPPTGAAAFAQVLEKLRPDYDWLVCDLAPASETSSCLAFVGALDGVVAVIEAGRTREAQAQRAKKLLLHAQARLLGVVLNKED